MVGGGWLHKKEEGGWRHGLWWVWVLMNDVGGDGRRKADGGMACGGFRCLWMMLGVMVSCRGRRKDDGATFGDMERLGRCVTG
ncbi:unnamed protein product [Prunus armeniaca]|uniref:Uncharacterized protein n=1 Tax=Prunus armeniaca TaxID=36596 RepID=A0A6J5V6X1_PRUAR|nr:unnamed protein product [Prunus armeniaca]